MPSRNVTLPESRLLSMIAGAFRYGAEQERMGEIADTERAYAASEHHALRLVEEFVDAGHIAVSEGTSDLLDAPARTPQAWRVE